ncbi:MAG: NTPase [Zestosphaera sp.]
MKIFISGYPGVGKTTVLMRVIDLLKRDGLVVGGIVCPEVREEGRRVGFGIVDLIKGDRGWLARLCGSQCEGPRVGRYCVNERDATSIGVNAIEKALLLADVVAIDEIGPMELAVPALKSAILKVVKGDKTLMAVIHWRLRNELIGLTSGRHEVVEITLTNRNHIYRDIYSKIRASTESPP